MKKIKYIAVFALLFVMIFSVSLTASANSSEVVYKNNFESGSLDDTFQITRGDLKVVNEKGEKFLRCTHEANKIQFAYGPEEQKNVDISFRLRATLFTNTNTATISPFFRSPHIPAWDTISYQLQFNTFQTSLIYADRFADETTLTPIAYYTDSGISVGLWNNVQISTRGDRIIVYLNGDRIIETADSNYGEYGGFGFCSAMSSFDIDDIVITRHYGKNLPEPQANERPLWAGDISEKEEPDIPDTGVIRIDLTTLGQEKVPVNNAIKFTNPFEASIYTWLAVAIAACSGASAVLGFVVLKRGKKGGKLK